MDGGWAGAQGGGGEVIDRVYLFLTLEDWDNCRVPPREKGGIARIICSSDGLKLCKSLVSIEVQIIEH